MELNIRYCQKNDFPEVIELLQQLWPDKKLDYDKMEKVFLKALDNDAQKLIVGSVLNQVVGFCSLTIKNNLWQVGNLGHIDELVVDEDVRGSGFGKKLMRRITEIAKENKCKRIELDSGFHREDAHTFYEGIGYENRAYLFSKRL